MEVGSEVTQPRGRRPGGRPLQHLLRLVPPVPGPDVLAVRDHPEHAACARRGSLFGYTKLYGHVPGAQAEYLRVPQAQFGPIKVPDGAARPPLRPPLRRAAHRLAGGGVRRRAARATRCRCTASGPIGQMAARIALLQGRGAGDRRRPGARAPGRWPPATASRPSTSATCGTPPTPSPSSPTGRPVPRGHRRGGHGGVGVAAWTRSCRPPRCSPTSWPPSTAPWGAVRRGGTLSISRRLRRAVPDVPAGRPVRQADHRPHGPGQREAVGRRHRPPPHRRRPPRASTTSSPTACRSTRPPTPTRSSRRRWTAASRSCWSRALGSEPTYSHATGAGGCGPGGPRGRPAPPPWCERTAPQLGQR